MSRSQRLSEKWFHRALWLIALIFASFLIGLGSLAVGDLPKIEQPLMLESFIDKTQAHAERAVIADAERKLHAHEAALEQAQLILQSTQRRSASHAKPLPTGSRHAALPPKAPRTQKSYNAPAN